jgi:hypothetical protein
VAWDGIAANPLDRTAVIERATYIHEFCVNGLQDAIKTNFKKPVAIDAKRLFWAGHSSGNVTKFNPANRRFDEQAVPGRRFGPSRPRRQRSRKLDKASCCS